LLAAPPRTRRAALFRSSPSSTADLSRRHQVTVSPSGLVTVTGGKLTSYRAMASDATDEVVRLLGRRDRSRTRRLALRGASGTASLKDAAAASRLGADRLLLAHLVARYGGEAMSLLALIREDPKLAQPLVEGLPYVAAEAVYAARDEMALTLDDVMSRRIRALPRRCRAAADAAPVVARLVAPPLHWSAEEQRCQLEGFARAVARYQVTPVGAPARPRGPVREGPP
jgi:glycerol-3-phosphate dehydrogenase